MQYDYTKPGADLAGLQQDIASAGLPVSHLLGDGDAFRVVTARALNDQEKSQLDSLVASHDPGSTTRRGLRQRAKLIIDSADPRDMANRVALKRVVSTLQSLRQWMTQVQTAVNALGANVPAPPIVRDYSVLEMVAKMDLDNGLGDPSQ